MAQPFIEKGIESGEASAGAQNERLGDTGWGPIRWLMAPSSSSHGAAE
jgi:hypothetical protein